ncbi:alpha/beta fold hydrolase [Nocardia uniformis]|uniref:Alpha/beta fold hydrolase n=1 Tax=Nocardia uniformis TaxID=53432 RepID=A0A849C175_9NOCA|nr:alpha/beta hydrolase [Nocardia uniformis]NNH72374.1 alpha/beta fold hydrolase [Nocardia uniformis]
MSIGKWIATVGLIIPLGIGCATTTDAPSTAPTTTQSGLDSFYSQKLDWKSCDEERLDEAGAQCADITVPLNYADPQGKTMTVAISRLAADPARKYGVMLSNSGGPGGPGLDFALDFGAAMTPEVRAGYDLIGMDPRGVGRSTRINCGWPRGFAMQSAGTDAASFAESVATQRDLAERCTDTEGERLPYITTRNTARDMDVIRGALSVDKISFYGTSYGTYLGSVFMQMFPERSDRIVLDSAADPDRYGPVEMMQDMGPANEAAFDIWAEWAAARDGEYHFGTTRDQVRATAMDLIRRSAEKPVRIGDFEVDEHDMPSVFFVGLDAPEQYPMLAEQVRRLIDAADGKQVEILPSLNESFAFMIAGRPEDASPQMAIMCGDVAVERDPDWYWRNIEATRATQPLFGGFANNIGPCAFWAPPVESPTVVDNSVPALIVQSTGDTRTTYAGAEAMHHSLSASRMVTLQDVPIHWIFGRYPNTCVYDAVNTYFRDGTLPATDTTCTAD